MNKFKRNKGPVCQIGWGQQGGTSSHTEAALPAGAQRGDKALYTSMYLLTVCMSISLFFPKCLVRCLPKGNSGHPRTVREPAFEAAILGGKQNYITKPGADVKISAPD